MMGSVVINVMTNPGLTPQHNEHTIDISRDPMQPQPIPNSPQPPPQHSVILAGPSPPQPAPVLAHPHQPPPPQAPLTSPVPYPPPPHATSSQPYPASTPTTINLSHLNQPPPPLPSNPSYPPQTQPTQHIAQHSNQPQLNLPVRDLLSKREDYINICVPLYDASMKGDWKLAKQIIDRNPNVVRSSITENHETALHVAASAKNTKFVKNLVNEMQEADMVLQNHNGNTAFCLAATAGTVAMAKSMVEKNRSVLITPGSQTMMPLYMAVLFANHEMASYLYENSQHLRDDNWTPENRGWLLVKCLENDMLGLALDILKNHPLVHNNDKMGALQALARKPSAFVGTNQHILWNVIPSSIRLKLGHDEKKNEALEVLSMIWKDVLQQPVLDIGDIIRGPKEANGFSSRALFVAAEKGNSKFIIHLIRSYPDLIWKTDEEDRSIFHVAVIHRQESVYNLLFEIGSLKDLITPLKDKKGNNMLHLAAMRPRRDRLQIVSGVPLQMQRELQWFRQVETMIPPSYRDRRNKANQTPQELFSEEHKKLVEEGEKWMKETANQCMIVAALIATMVFAAAFTVPGGYNQNNGIPMFLPQSAFMVFVISDAVSLFLSASSILIFLSILTSRYAEQDFLVSLPRKLMLGLATLFLSITTMMIAFSASFFDIYKNGLKWAPILIAVFACFPVVLYLMLQFRLFVDVIRSTSGSKYLFKPKKHVLY